MSTSWIDKRGWGKAAVGAASALALLLWAGRASGEPPQAAPTAGTLRQDNRTLAPFTLPSVDGLPTTVAPGEQPTKSAPGGRVLVLNFWAFWCDTWKAELPQLKELAARQDELGIRLVAVTVDGTRAAEYDNYTHGGHLPFPVLLDVNGKITRRYAIGHVPTVLIVTPEGRIRYSGYGYPGNDQIIGRLRGLKKEVR